MGKIVGIGATKKVKTYTEEDVNKLIASKDSEIGKLKEEVKKAKSNDSKTSESKKVKDLKEQIDTLAKEKEDAIAENTSLKEQIDTLAKKVEELETSLQNNDSEDKDVE